jgi:hypothetical protein
MSIPVEVLAPQLRAHLLGTIGFDPYRSSQFVEAIVCYAANLRLTPHSHLVDGIGDDGLRVEVKYASMTLDKRVKVDRERFCFRHLRGRRLSGKRADVFVFVGFMDDDLRFYVIPSALIALSRRDLEIFPKGQTSHKNKWLQFEVRVSELKTAIGEADRLRADYPGLIQQSLITAVPGAA